MNLDLNAMKTDHEQLKESSNRNSSGFLDNFVKMPEGKGTVTLRFLSPAKGGMFEREKSPFYQATRTHRVNNKSLHCPREMVNGKLAGECEICKYLRWVWTESEKSDPDEKKRLQTLYREIKAIDRFYYNVVVRNVADEASGKLVDVGPKIFSCGKTLHGMILTGIVGDPDIDVDGYGDVTDLKNGRDFKIVKTIKKSPDGNFPEYSRSQFVDSTGPTGSPEQIEEWLDNLHDLVSLRVVKTQAELEHELQCHLGMKTADDGDFDHTKYQSGADDDSATVTVVSEVPKAEAEVDASASVSASAADDISVDDVETETETDKPVADEDFLAELQGM